jgi:hypothetical protein
MSNVDAERLYQLLPAIYRLRDDEQEYPLHALIEVLAGQAQVIEADIARLYENWFVETCDEWVVPYIGDLLGVRGLLPPERAGWSQRALVANTLQYRQRKGTVPLLEQLVHDVTGWAGRTVELYNAVGVTQYLDHLRPGMGGTANLRELREDSLIGSAFDPLCYTADVRLMSGTRQAPQLEAERPISLSGRRLAGVGQGRPNLPNIGLYIWRLKSYHLERVTAFSHGDGQRFSFSPLGIDVRLFNDPGDRRDFTNVSQEYELPVALRTVALAEELAARRRAMAQGMVPVRYFFGDKPPFEIYLPGSTDPLPPEELIICDLSEWTCDSVLPQDQKGDWTIQAAVDPALGRIALVKKIADDARLRTGYSFNFSDDIGGGPYDRRRQASNEIDMLSNPCALGTLIIIGKEDKDKSYGCTPQYVAPEDAQALAKALQVWAGQQPAVIQINGNDTYFMPATGLNVNLNNTRLTLQAANGCRPVLAGNINIKGGGPAAELTLSGLLIAGQISISGPLSRLTVLDCTLSPGIAVSDKGSVFDPTIPSIVAKNTDNALQVRIVRSIVGPVDLPQTIKGLSVADSIIDAPEPIQGSGQSQLRALAGPVTRLERVTVFGKMSVSEISAQDVLFTSLVTANKGTAGNCYFTKAPAGVQSDNCVEDADGLLPVFTARRYGEPGYAQLSLSCPAEIRAGGTDGAEIGVFHDLRQPQREGALLAQLEEYLRFGLEAGLIYMD